MDEKKPGRPVDEAGDEKRNRVPRPDQWSTAMDELIENAMAKGQFDNLPGRGKPLKLSTNPFTPETELAYQLLKDNRYTLPWIAERKALLERIEAFREDLGHLWARYQAEFKAARSETIKLSLKVNWGREIANLSGEIETLNKSITAVNLKQSQEHLEIFKLALDHELARAGASETL